MREATEVGITHLGAPGPPGAPWWVVLSSEHPLGAARAHRSTKNYSRIIKEAPMDMMNPSVMVSRLDLVVLELAAAGIDFCRLP